MGTVIKLKRKPPRRSPKLVRANPNLVRAIMWPVVLGAVVGLYWINTSAPNDPTDMPDALFATFSLCKTARQTTCIVDGDTFWFKGKKIRIADIDTPEVSEPSCSAEAERGEAAKQRLLQLMNAGRFSLVAAGQNEKDRYGRTLRVVMREGRSIGDILVAERLARRWGDRSPSWCG